MNTKKQTLFQLQPEDTEELEYIENIHLQCPSEDELMERKSEWDEIDDLVFEYQKKAQPNVSEEQIYKSDLAAMELIERFYPLFKKYLNLIKTGQINFKNMEQRLFVRLFMEEVNLKFALCYQKELDKNTKSIIYQKFNFVRETYGHLDPEEIMTDLHYLFLILAKRYKKMERSFCCYVFYAFKFEVARHIQKFTRNPANIHYRNTSYEELSLVSASADMANNTLDDDITDKVYTNELGLPNISWIQGLSCSEEFQLLTPLERKIIVKYYLEKKNDRQIAYEYGVHINTVNIKRHTATKKLADALGIDYSKIKRGRNSGLKTL